MGRTVLKHSEDQLSAEATEVFESLLSDADAVALFSQGPPDTSQETIEARMKAWARDYVRRRAVAEEAAQGGQRRRADLIDVLATDHQEMVELLGKLESLPSGDSQRRPVAEAILIELVRHSVADDHYLYPAVREYLEGGEALAEAEIEDHMAIEQLLQDLERVPADDSRFDSLLTRLMREVYAHFQDEEEHLFPALRKACPSEVLTDLGEKASRTKKMSPTRPNPSSPDEPPANKLLAPGVGLVDRFRDRLADQERET
ncbi:hemerythrin domain-containing protein [Streptomyces sp. N2A]|uniref:hemerythrin domain-containing protein n=1 Tax=Streptomyces sp. N2A TaxID=3073936 RepID=UPI002870767E|nr:hemerythrin domain-containing protein [Streptomyces sp. N2A]